MKTCYHCDSGIRHKSDEVEMDDGAVLHQKCVGAYRAKMSSNRSIKVGGAAAAPMGVIVTTLPLVANREIDFEIDVISSEAVYGMNIFRDITSGIRDIVGGRSGGTQKVLRGCREAALTELKQQAGEVGADAVVGIDLDFSEFSGGGKSMLFVVATGTAVKLKPKN